MMGLSTTDTTRSIVERLTQAVRDASRAVGGAQADPTTPVADYRQLLQEEADAITALQAFLAPRQPAGKLEAVRDFYASLHGDNGLALRIRAEQALGRLEVTTEMGGNNWRTWLSIRSECVRETSSL